MPLNRVRDILELIIIEVTLKMTCLKMWLSNRGMDCRGRSHSHAQLTVFASLSEVLGFGSDSDATVWLFSATHFATAYTGDERKLQAGEETYFLCIKHETVWFSHGVQHRKPFCFETLPIVVNVCHKCRIQLHYCLLFHLRIGALFFVAALCVQLFFMNSTNSKNVDSTVK